VLPVAVVFALSGVVFAGPLWVRLLCATFALLTAAMAAWQHHARPALILDEQGYAVEEHGKEKLRVAWSEVKQVRTDEAEQALYVDCGDPSRNLLLPPKRGYGFRFERAERAYAAILTSVSSDKVLRVARLDNQQLPPAK
jgi:hypothetical protein